MNQLQWLLSDHPGTYVPGRRGYQQPGNGSHLLSVPTSGGAVGVSPTASPQKWGWVMREPQRWHLSPRPARLTSSPEMPIKTIAWSSSAGASRDRQRSGTTVALSRAQVAGSRRAGPLGYSSDRTTGAAIHGIHEIGDGEGCDRAGPQQERRRL